MAADASGVATVVAILGGASVAAAAAGASAGAAALRLPLFGGLVVIRTRALFLQRGQRVSRAYRPVPSVTGSPGLRPHARSSRSTALLLTSVPGS